MPRAAEAPRRRRKPTELRQSELVDAAIRLVALQGARGLTTARLAAAVGLSSGAIFRHFPTMDALVVAMTARLEALLFADFSPPPADPIERLGVFFQQRVRTLVEQPLLVRLLQGDALAHVGSGAGAAQVAAFKRRSVDFVRQTLREAEQRGLLGGAADLETGAVLVLGAVHAIGHAGALRSDDPTGLTGLAARVWSTLETTLRGRPLRVARPSPARRRVASRGGAHVKE